MKRLRILVLACAVLVLLCGCLYDIVTPDEATITIYNPSGVDVAVKCFFFRDSKDIVVPAYGRAEAVVHLRDSGDPVNLYTTSRYHMTTDSDIEVDFNPYGMSCTLMPDVSWMEVTNLTGEILDFTGFGISQYGGSRVYCLYDENGELAGSSTLLPGETKWIMFTESRRECGVMGWILCSIDGWTYATNRAVRSPSAGLDSLCILAPYDLERQPLI